MGSGEGTSAGSMDTLGADVTTEEQWWYGLQGFQIVQPGAARTSTHQAWRLLDRPDSLCARVLKAKYFPQGNLLDTVAAGEASPTWRAIEHGLELLKHGTI